MQGPPTLSGPVEIGCFDGHTSQKGWRLSGLSVFRGLRRSERSAVNGGGVFGNGAEIGAGGFTASTQLLRNGGIGR